MDAFAHTAWGLGVFRHPGVGHGGWCAQSAAIGRLKSIDRLK